MNGERDFWDMFAHSILPVWVQMGRVNPKFVGAFSEGFELDLTFAKPKPFIADKEKVETEIRKLDAGLTTKREAIMALRPNMTDEQAEMKVVQIENEKMESMKLFQANMVQSNNNESDNDREDEAS